MAIMKVRLGWLFSDLRAETLGVSARRRKAMIPVIGREGDIHQDMGSQSRQIVVRGSLYATVGMRLPIWMPTLPTGFFDVALTEQNPHPIIVKQYLDLVWRLKWPVPFISDLLITFVTVDEIDWQIDSAQPNVYHYNIVLTEFSTPLGSVAFQPALAFAATNAQIVAGGALT